uniref:Putative secreted protein n=1 Tax=Anopheles darlingi TaxID=43151 RepID=A0A2M4D491_ANODA
MVVHFVLLLFLLLLLLFFECSWSTPDVWLRRAGEMNCTNCDRTRHTQRRNATGISAYITSKLKHETAASPTPLFFNHHVFAGAKMRID